MLKADILKLKVRISISRLNAQSPNLKHNAQSSTLKSHGSFLKAQSSKLKTQKQSIHIKNGL